MPLPAINFQAIATGLLSIIEDVAPIVDSSATATKIIQQVETIVPALGDLGHEAAASVQNIIESLLSNDDAGLTADQTTALQGLSAQADAAYDAAWAAYLAAHP